MGDRAEGLYRSLGRSMGWSLDRCEFLVEEYAGEEYKEDEGEYAEDNGEYEGGDN